MAPSNGKDLAWDFVVVLVEGKRGYPALLPGSEEGLDIVY